jgi:membrane-associated phospholipid phosphatase
MAGFLIILAAMILIKLFKVVGILIVIAAILYGYSTIDIHKPPWYKRKP